MYCASPSARTRLSRSALYLALSASGSKSITISAGGGVEPSIRLPRFAQGLVGGGSSLERLTNLEHAPILLSMPAKGGERARAALRPLHHPAAPGGPPPPHSTVRWRSGVAGSRPGRWMTRQVVEPVQRRPTTVGSSDLGGSGSQPRGETAGFACPSGAPARWPQRRRGAVDPGGLLRAGRAELHQ